MILRSRSISRGKAPLDLWHKTAVEELKSHCALYFKHSIEWLLVSQTFPPFKQFAWPLIEEGATALAATWCMENRFMPGQGLFEADRR